MSLLTYLGRNREASWNFLSVESSDWPPHTTWQKGEVGDVREQQRWRQQETATTGKVKANVLFAITVFSVTFNTGVIMFSVQVDGFLVAFESV